MNFYHFCLIFASIWTIDAKVSMQRENEHKECYNSTMEDINYSKFLNGEWLEKERNTNKLEMSCEGIQYTVNDDGFKILFKENNSTFTGRFKNESASITFEDIPLYSYNVVETDYDNYAVVYACAEFEEDHTSILSEYIWVLSRNDTMTDNSDTLLADHEPLRDLLKNNVCQTTGTSTTESSPETSPSATSDATEVTFTNSSPTVSLNTTTTPQTSVNVTSASSPQTTSLDTVTTPSETTVNDTNPTSPATKVPEEPSTSLPPLIPAFNVDGRRVFFISQLFV